jgi:antitoxin component of MazEF toxin-antitoxin module
MPIIRKVIGVGGSKAVSIPRSWLELIERETGQKVTEVAMEVDRVLTISPILQKIKKTEAEGTGGPHA